VGERGGRRTVYNSGKGGEAEGKEEGNERQEGFNSRAGREDRKH
jgi:hypothetical protein